MPRQREGPKADTVWQSSRTVGTPALLRRQPGLPQSLPPPIYVLGAPGRVETMEIGKAKPRIEHSDARHRLLRRSLVSAERGAGRRDKIGRDEARLRQRRPFGP